MAAQLKLIADLDEVIDTAVEDHTDVAIGRDGMGWAPALAQIDDRQTPVSEAHARPLVIALAIGTAAGERGEPGADDALRRQTPVRGCEAC